MARKLIWNGNSEHYPEQRVPNQFYSVWFLSIIHQLPGHTQKGLRIPFSYDFDLSLIILRVKGTICIANMFFPSSMLTKLST